MRLCYIYIFTRSNITSKKVNGKTYAYTYDGNKLMSFNGESCEYDNIGNPIKYRGNALSWKGRQLSYFNDHHFSYEGTTGRRCSKNSISYTYDENGNLVKQSDGIKYFYNSFGVAGIIKGGVKYHYSKDVQGNIIAILDSTGKVVVQYWYDAWGNHKVVDVNGNAITDPNHIGNINPFRYRGYYYDVETGLYYLQTRYYDPEVGRFISRDSIEYADPETVHGLNLYAYCLNNPVSYIDPTGQWIETILDLIFIGWDIYNLATNDGWKKWENWVALVADIAFAVIPFATGGGQVVKIGDEINDINRIKRSTVVGETMDRVKDTSILFDNLKNLYNGFTAYDNLSSLGKGGKILAEIGGKVSNAMWLYGKLRTGYTIIDIGIDLSRARRSSSYIMERIILSIWKYRNFWKLSYHLL